MKKGIFGIIAGISLLVVLLGCVEEQQGPGTGNFVLLISDTEADISDFDSVIVTLSSARVFMAGNGNSPDANNGAGYEVIDLSGTTIDLTEVVGEKAIPVAEIQLAEGRYTKIELIVESVEATLLDGNTAEVAVPSNTLKIVKQFTIDANAETKFVFDIQVVKKGPSDGYNLSPVISKSGVVGEDLGENEVEELTKEEAKRLRDEERQRHRAQEEEQEGEGEDGGVGSAGGNGGGPGPEVEAKGKGDFVLLLSDAEADIADFNSVLVSFEKVRIFSADTGDENSEGQNNGSAGYVEEDLNGVTVDLTMLVGEKAVPILELELTEGKYTKIELTVESIEATLQDGNTAIVGIASNTLKITRQFTIDANTETKFVFDIQIVKKGSSEEYNITPVIGKSGVVGKDLEEDEVEEIETSKANKQDEEGEPDEEED